MAYFSVAEVSSLDTSDLIEAFEFLDDLRSSGEANMFTEAQGYLTGVIDGWDRPQIRSAHLAWMKTFAKNKLVEERVREALTAA